MQLMGRKNDEEENPIILR